MRNRWWSAFRAFPLILLGLTTAAPSRSAEVEVLHRWTSGGEARSLEELKKMVKQRGVDWRDFAVVGNIGSAAALQARVDGGKPPTAAQINPPAMRQLGHAGKLANIDAVAQQGHWDENLNHVIADVVKVDKHYVAVPLNIHRENWLWINTEVLEKAGAKVPVTLDEFFETAEKIKRVGIIPIARGGQPWQDNLMLESAVLGVGGPDFYRKVYAEQDRDAVRSPTMQKAFEALARMRSYTDKYAPERNWNTATSMIIHGKGGMQFMGDWAKGDFAAAGRKAGKDFVCVPAPGTRGAFIFTIDSLSMFANTSHGQSESQAILAETIMSPQFQEVFNLNKGSIPARMGVGREKFDSCAQASMDDLNAATKHGALVPSLSMAAPPEKVTVFQQLAYKFMNTAMSPSEAAETLAAQLSPR